MVMVGGEWYVSRCARASSKMTTIILPGERVPAAHVNLKLGPGLTQISKSSPTLPDVGDKPYIVATKAGELKQSANGSKWWVDNNSRRVSSQLVPGTV